VSRARLGSGSRGSELLDATEELLLRDMAVALGVPLLKEVVQPVALLIQYSVPFLHRIDVGALCIEPLLCLQAEVHENLLGEDGDVEEEGNERKPAQPRGRYVARGVARERDVVLKHHEQRHLPCDTSTSEG